MDKRWRVAGPLALVAALSLGFSPTACTPHAGDNAPEPPQTVAAGAVDAIEHAYQHRLTNHQLSGTGTVIKLLKDDNEGRRHQRFIIRVASGRTLLVSHNIDLAKRIEALTVGDTVSFYGEYEWNARGGVIHWTHHDPEGRHAAGWIKHRGQLYQ